MAHSSWFSVRQPLAPRRRFVLSLMSFGIPLLIWCLVSYVPAVWHPMIKITDPGSVSYFSDGMLLNKDLFYKEQDRLEKEGKAPPQGIPANPVYLPTPGAVATAFYTAFTTPPQRRDEKWLYQSLGDSISVIFLGFLISSLIAIPLGILAGTFDLFSRLTEPFVEFFRYLPAPAFGALAVAILGINEAPKIAIIVIGTFFQQVLVVANTTRKIDTSLLEAAMTLGANRLHLLFRVVIPGMLPDLFRDVRVLLGWAWTYLIVAEMIGASSGITWFITQQARYKNFENVYAAIMMIGFIGITTDLLLAWLSRRIFPWQRGSKA
ncbi:binding-protein-dependent transport systems inner membrane component [Halothiobacillus neapolitanus c2]|uniref:Binding-protein-dependent transport systems inner membrane component n=2 Tax=Halothiobacillus neapolitanus TaxID=927 RepID=D0KYW7_HALNC|nr:binding-protein-dependent transport systems inner membrane component [Halothiobacillus neapolitanus c2]TDN65943.1 NitT/TauT family transport system permease protein [Halothiobacillus neapolitanus]